MGKLEKVLEELIEAMPRKLLKKRVKEKLREAGVTDKQAIDAFADHVMSDSDKPFTWDEGEEGPLKTISIKFTEDDGKEIIEKLEKFVRDDLKAVIDTSIDDTGKSIVKLFMRRWPSTKIDSKHELAHFKDRVDLTWSKGLDPLRILLTASREIGNEFAARLDRSKAKKGILKRQALLALHIRACQTTLEILTLIDNGLPDGAYARWRTLYELTVVAFVINKYGDDLAERYFAHDSVSLRENSKNEFRFNGETYDVENLTDEALEIEQDYQRVISKFGNAISSPYGWAADALNIRKPTFQNLENAVDWGSLPPEYKTSSYKVHAGAVGTFRSLGLLGKGQTLHAGASNYGLDTPAIMTAQTLLQITSLMFKEPYDLEISTQVKSLIILRDKVTKHCTKTANRIEREELANIEND